MAVVTAEPQEGFADMMLYDRRIVSGALSAVGGAYVWAFLWVLFTSERGSDFIGELILFPAYCVLLTCWFVVPLGAVLGVFLPRLIAGRSASQTLGIGVLVGAGAGLVATALTTLFEQLPYLTGPAESVNWPVWRRWVFERTLQFLASMTPLCGVWVGIWALVLRARALRHQAT